MDKTTAYDVIIDTLMEMTCDKEEDEPGELVIYTGIYKWRDGSYHFEEEQVVPIH